MLTLLLYVLIVGLVAALLFLVASAVFGRGEELGPLPEGTTATVLPATGIHGGDVRSLRFQQVFRGYKTGEVDWALARLAARIDELETQLVQVRGDQPGNGSTGAFPAQAPQTGPWTRTREWPTGHSATTQHQTPGQAWHGIPDGGAPTAHSHPPAPVADRWQGPEVTQPTGRPAAIPAVAPGTPPAGQEPASPAQDASDPGQPMRPGPARPEEGAQPPPGADTTAADQGTQLSHTLNMSTSGHDGSQATGPGSTIPEVQPPGAAGQDTK
ncbi:hypothetical protein GCM10027089_56540 [Nocardia thraciensis]